MTAATLRDMLQSRRGTSGETEQLCRLEFPHACRSGDALMRLLVLWSGCLCGQAHPDAPHSFKGSSKNRGVDASSAEQVCCAALDSCMCLPWSSGQVRCGGPHGSEHSSQNLANSSTLRSWP
eukprot:NODE_26016_length_567_cov_5.465909.p1 GENE.NODE_26016_length_567_cov_5.465909~~NODE_26016_length_567_cov_5.465909.p1  ORF type:complete len:122 (-),score=3.38 NODE_26016_length_567_cov_5.465909:119-484(-)